MPFPLIVTFVAGIFVGIGGLAVALICVDMRARSKRKRVARVATTAVHQDDESFADVREIILSAKRRVDASRAGAAS